MSTLEAVRNLKTLSLTNRAIRLTNSEDWNSVVSSVSKAWRLYDILPRNLGCPAAVIRAQRTRSHFLALCAVSKFLTVHQTSGKIDLMATILALQMSK